MREIVRVFNLLGDFFDYLSFFLFFLCILFIQIGVFVIGATNLPEALDYSLLAGRLPLLEVPPPSAKDRVTILRSITQQMPVASDVK